MHWLVQNSLRDENKFSSLIDNVVKMGQDYTMVDVIPFVGKLVNDVDIGHKNVMCFGSYSMRLIAKKNGWLPGIYDIDWFPYQSLIECLGKDVLNHDAVFGKFGSIVPNSDMFFFRPTHDGKEFAGVLKSAGQLKEWQAKVGKLGENVLSLDVDTEVMCSSIKGIYNEFRYFVVDGRVVTGSQYKLGKKVIYDKTDEGIDNAQKFVDILNDTIKQPYVIDLALTSEGYKVIELNTLNCAGFYASDMQKLVHALIEYEGNK